MLDESVHCGVLHEIACSMMWRSSVSFGEKQREVEVASVAGVRARSRSVQGLVRTALDKDQGIPTADSLFCHHLSHKITQLLAHGLQDPPAS